MKYDNYTFFIGLLVLVASCTTKSPETGYRLLKPNRTGIDFNNKIVETDSLNPVEYLYIYNGGGVGVGDINNDSLPDIFFAGNLESSRLFLNMGNLKFEDITQTAGVGTDNWCTGVSMVDINADGHMDIYVSAADRNNTEKGRNLLFINQGDATFKEEAASYGLDDMGYSTQAVFFDYDKDNDLDMYLLTNAMDNKQNYLLPISTDGTDPSTDRLYRNNGDLTFTNVSKEAGITIEGYGLGVGITDINQDGWPDVYCANDFITNDLLWVNQRDGTFKDSITTYFNQISLDAMGMDIADFNNDGLQDIITVDMLPETNEHYKNMVPPMNYSIQVLRYRFGYMPQFVRNTLHLRQAGSGFSEMGRLAGIDKTDWSWGPLFLDMDNDGWKDLFISNGYGRDVTNLDFVVYSNNPFGTMEERKKKTFKKMLELPTLELSNYFFHNATDLTFNNVTKDWGLYDPNLSNGAAYADFDLDGDLDLVTNNINSTASFYENLAANKPKANHYLKIDLKGTGQNIQGIGAQVALYHNDNIQVLEQYPVRGFVSSVEPLLHFGLGAETQVDSLVVTWPDQKRQLLKNVKADQIITLDHGNAIADMIAEKSPEPLFLAQNDRVTGIKHKENGLIDFEIQPLLLKMLSREGPGLAVSDVNEDGLEDLFFGSAFQDTTFIWLQTKEGLFQKGNSLFGSWLREDQGALFFDYDADGDADLYVASGGNQLKFGRRNDFYQDRLYENDGLGNFELKDRGVLPNIQTNASTVNGCDYDKDGDIDLFVGSRVVPHNYPQSGRSLLLQNTNKRFKDVAPEALAQVGMVTSSIWSDFDNDGWIDLIVTGEWMPVQFFKNNKGILESYAETGIENRTGLWNSISGADVDRDGDIDYIVGNHGVNNDLGVSKETPLKMVAKDFDRNQSVDPVMGYYIEGECYPLPTRDALLSQINFLKKRFPNYGSYARTTFDGIFTEEELKGATNFEVNALETSFIENLGNGKFAMRPLPIEAQMAPVYGVMIDHVDDDQFLDVILTGNRKDSELVSGFLDGAYGKLLLGDGKGNFRSVSNRTSGLDAPEDLRGIVKVQGLDAPSYLFAVNDGQLKAYGTKVKNGNIEVLPNEVHAILTYEDGSKSKVELYHGAGYFSQSSRNISITTGVSKVEVFDAQGKSRTISLDSDL